MARPLAEIDQDIAAFRQARTDIITAGQSSSRPGLSISLPALKDINETLSLLLAERAVHPDVKRGGCVVLSDFSSDHDRGLPT